MHACQFICVCVLKSSHSPRLRLEEDVVEDNIVARIKLCYGHFEVWSLSHPSTQMSLKREQERAAILP